jgi:hypothetical protein
MTAAHCLENAQGMKGFLFAVSWDLPGHTGTHLAEAANYRRNALFRDALHLTEIYRRGTNHHV